MNKEIFCAHCQADTSHSMNVASENLLGHPIDPPEIVAKCSRCGREIKFPTTVGPEEFNQLLAVHKQDNQLGSQSAEPAPVPTPTVPETNAPAEPAAEGSGPRAQDNLTPAEQATWAQMQASSPIQPVEEPNATPVDSPSSNRPG